MTQKNPKNQEPNPKNQTKFFLFGIWFSGFGCWSLDWIFGFRWDDFRSPLSADNRLLFRHGHEAVFQHLHLLGRLDGRRGLGRRHRLGRCGLNGTRRRIAGRRACLVLDLAGGHAFFFFLDFHNQVLTGTNVLALLTAAAVVACSVMASAPMHSPETIFGSHCCFCCSVPYLEI